MAGLYGGKYESIRFIASDNVLPEIVLSGLQKLKVIDIKKMKPLPRGPIPFEKLDDDLEGGVG